MGLIFCHKINPFMLSVFFYHNSLEQSISSSRVSGFCYCYVVFNANSVDPDQMPQTMASDLVLTVYQLPFWDFPTKMV